MTTNLEQVKELFLKAVEVVPDQRESFLSKECQDNPQLRQEVEQLLRGHMSGISLVDRVINDGETFDEPGKSPFEGQQIGPYKLREKIGEGGFGVVYVAEQKEPVSRKVALKVIKPGMDSEDIIARFEAERQALAMMDHPNVAKVLDAGATESGRPYFVMELVHGVAITEYCDSRKLTNRQRLDLFIDVCHAVQHAHQKGIIHRDLKPSNILVTKADHRAIVKVIDFGVAKALHHDLTDKSIYTGYGQMVGTPMYMSPEQAELSSLDVDTRSDIYSLGVLLYELLTGTTPFDKETFKKAGFDEVRRMIREVEPRRPSEQVSTLEAELISTVSDSRGIDQRSLSKALRGELDWIVMKTLEKDRTRRYETATSLAEDVQRFLDEEPVVACPPSHGYRFRKFARRNKTAISFALLVSVFAVASIIALAVANSQIRTQKQLAEQNEATSRREAEYARAITDFVKDDFLALASAEGRLRTDEVSSYGLTNVSTLKNLVDRAAAKLDKRSDLNPRAEAEIRWMIGVNYRAFGEHSKAIESLETAVELFDSVEGCEPETVLGARNSLAAAYGDAGLNDKCIEIATAALETAETMLGRKHPTTLLIALNLGISLHQAGQRSKAMKLLNETMECQKTELGIGDRSTLRTMQRIAILHYKVGETDKAASALAETIELQREHLGYDDIDTIDSINNLAEIHRRSQKFQKAIPLFEEAVRMRIKTLGDNHPGTLKSMVGLSKSLRDTGQFNESIDLMEKTLSLSQVKWGADHTFTLDRTRDLAKVYRLAGEPTKSVELLEKLSQILTATQGLEHPDTLHANYERAKAYRESGEWNKSISLFEGLLESEPSALETAQIDPLIVKSNLAATYAMAGQIDESIGFYEEILKEQKVTLPANHSETLNTLNTIATLYWRRKQLDKSIPLFEEVVERFDQSLGRTHWITRNAIVNLAVNYKDAGQVDDALPLLVEVGQAVKTNVNLTWSLAHLANAYIQIGEFEKGAMVADEYLGLVDDHLPKNSQRLAMHLTLICSQYFLQIDDFEEAEKHLRRAARIWQDQDPDGWRTLRTKSLLGEALAEQAKFAEAEELILHAYDGLVRAKGSIPENTLIKIPRSIERLIELYEASEESSSKPNAQRILEQLRQKLSEFRTKDEVPNQ